MTLWVCVDESGDTGFGEKASKHLVFGIVITDNIDKLNKRLRELKKSLGIREFKSSKGIIEEVIPILNSTQNLSVIFKKSRDIEGIFYYRAGLQLALSVALARDPHIIMVIDNASSLGKTKRQELSHFLQSFGEGVGKVEVQFKDSISFDCIQLADYVAGLTFRKYERNRDYSAQIKEFLI